MRKPREASRATRATLLSSALREFNARGFDGVTVADICTATGLSNGTFFHQFPSKESLAAEIYLDALRHYHRAMVGVLADEPPAAEGIIALIRAHLTWVEEHRSRARFLFELTHPEWLTLLQSDQEKANAEFLDAIETWRMKHVAAGDMLAMPIVVCISQIIGPAQIVCRAWLSGRSRTLPHRYANDLTACAIRSLCS